MATLAYEYSHQKHEVNIFRNSTGGYFGEVHKDGQIIFTSFWNDITAAMKGLDNFIDKRCFS